MRHLAVEPVMLALLKSPLSGLCFVEALTIALAPFFLLSSLYDLSHLLLVVISQWRTGTLFPSVLP